MVVSAHLISILQKGSADACYALFRLIGVPVLRNGFRFALPGVEIEVAEQCSGIHSGLSLFIAGLLAEYVLLRGAWKKALLHSVHFSYRDIQERGTDRNHRVARHPREIPTSFTVLFTARVACHSRFWLSP